MFRAEKSSARRRECHPFVDPMEGRISLSVASPGEVAVAAARRVPAVTFNLANRTVHPIIIGPIQRPSEIILVEGPVKGHHRVFTFSFIVREGSGTEVVQETSKGVTDTHLQFGERVIARIDSTQIGPILGVLRSALP
jgi:hypothetical protein